MNATSLDLLVETVLPTTGVPYDQLGAHFPGIVASTKLNDKLAADQYLERMILNWHQSQSNPIDTIQVMELYTVLSNTVSPEH